MPKVFPHPSRRHDENWAILGDFDTGLATLRGVHFDWLNYYAVTHLNKGGWVFIRGMASHLGRERGYDNLQLSKQRAQAVHEHLLSKEQILHRTPSYANHITRVEAVGDTRAGGAVDDNCGFWRAVEVIATPHRIQPPPPPPESLPERTKSLPRPRFSIRVARSAGVGPANELQVQMRDAWRQVQVDFEMTGFGVSATPFNLGRPGRWSTIPDDHYLGSLYDFDHARVELVGADVRNRDGSQAFSYTYFRIRPIDLRTRAITLQDFDTGESLFPDVSASSLVLHARSAEHPY